MINIKFLVIRTFSKSEYIEKAMMLLWTLHAIYLFPYSALGWLFLQLYFNSLGTRGWVSYRAPYVFLQRVGYLGIAISCLLAAGIRPLRKVFNGLAVLAAAYGVAVAGHHVWLLSHPGESCGIDPLELWINQFQLANTLPWLFKADGLCSAKLPAILGLQVPEWSLLWFGLLLIVLVVAFFQKSKA